MSMQRVLFGFLQVNTLPIARILIIFITLWLPTQSIAAVGMMFCQQIQKQEEGANIPADIPAADIADCNQSDPGAMQTCELCDSCIVCPMPTLSANHAMLFPQVPFSFELVALWQPYARVLDVLERPPRSSHPPSQFVAN